MVACLQVNGAEITDLEPLVSYHVLVQAYNDVGDGPAVKPVILETPAGLFVVNLGGIVTKKYYT